MRTLYEWPALGRSAAGVRASGIDTLSTGFEGHSNPHRRETRAVSRERRYSSRALQGKESLMVTNATVRPAITTRSEMRWGRIVIGAVLLETVLIVAAIPLLGFVANPLAPGAQNASGDYTFFFMFVTVACFVVGALLGAWVARPLSSRIVLHGALTGIVATAIYLGICSIPPTTVAAVFAAYGPMWFLLA